MTKTVVNVPASVRARLLRRAKELPEDFSLLLQRYAAERFLYRLSQTPQRSHFVLKGAMLFAVWDHSLYRSTRDLDLAGFGAGDGRLLATAIRTISAIACPDDGIEFLTAGIQVDPIRDASEEVATTGEEILVALQSFLLPILDDLRRGDAAKSTWPPGGPWR